MDEISDAALVGHGSAGAAADGEVDALVDELRAAPVGPTVVCA